MIFKPELRNRNGSAPASGAVFRALAENPGAQKCSRRWWQHHAQPADREGAASVSDLAQALRVRPQSMAQTIGDLEAEGMVARNPDPNDRRRALVSLTPAGRARIEEDRAVREGWLVKALEELPEADRETVERAVGILSRLAAADV